MDQSLKVVKTVYLMMLFSMVMLAVVGEVVAGERDAGSGDLLLWLFAVMALGLFVGVILLKQMKIVPAAEEIAVMNELNAQSIGKWQAGHLISFALAESIVLYSIVLRNMGFPLSNTAYFVVAGFVAMLIVTPSDPRR